jgi:uncharacterized protein (DUF2147 family)
VWLTQATDGRVRIGPCAGHPDLLCGSIIWAKGPKGEDGRTLNDENNPDPALRSRPIVGLPILWDFHADGSGGWTGGKIYNPTEGKTYKSKIAPGRNGTLKVSGCVLVVCQTQTWTRVE